MHCFSPAIGNSQLNHEGHESEEVDDNNEDEEDEENEHNGVDDWQLGLEGHDHDEKKAVLLIREDFHLTVHGWVTFPHTFQLLSDTFLPLSSGLKPEN